MVQRQAHGRNGLGEPSAAGPSADSAAAGPLPAAFLAGATAGLVVAVARSVKPRAGSKLRLRDAKPNITTTSVLEKVPVVDATSDTISSPRRLEEQQLQEPQAPQEPPAQAAAPAESEGSLGAGGDVEGVLNILTGNPLNLLLAFVPLGLASEGLGWSGAATFGLNFLAILPLASILGVATEELAIAVGPSLGGLLNATFGNAVEMILTVFALKEGLVDVVKDSLVGSVLSNLLLVMGMSFVAGGLKYKEQAFNSDGARTQSSLLLLAVLAMVLPTLVAVVPSAAGAAAATAPALSVSRGCAVVLAGLYVLYLYFQFVTHKESFDEEEEEEMQLSPGASTAVLLVSTLAIAACSEGLTGSVGAVTKELGISEAFVGVMLLPIVGNAAEHITAVSVAAKNKMDLAVGITLGSSTQIALFMVPFSVVMGWVLGVPMDLNFHVLPASVMLLSALVVSSIVSDGRSNWLEGAMLMSAYVLIAIAFWYS